MNTLYKLQELTDLIEDTTEGKQRLEPRFAGGGVDIQTEHGAYTALLMRKDIDFETGNITLRFQGCIRQMGKWMSAKDFRFAAEEIHEMGNLLYELEQRRLTVTPDALQQWADWLTERGLEQEQSIGCQPGSVQTMEMV